MHSVKKAQQVNILNFSERKQTENSVNAERKRANQQNRISHLSAGQGERKI